MRDTWSQRIKDDGLSTIEFTRREKTVQKNLFEETMIPPGRNDDTSGEMMTPREKR